jgi:hypothetical protein
MKRLLAVFVLTPPEQRLVIFVMLALVVGVSIKHYRDMNVDARPRAAQSAVTPLVSPTPNVR